MGAPLRGTDPSAVQYGNVRYKYRTVSKTPKAERRESDLELTGQPDHPSRSLPESRTVFRGRWRV